MKNRATTRTFAAAGLAATFGALGCAQALPPKELVDARASYERAGAGIAAKLAPAALDTAKQALQKAERQFVSEEDTPETRALADRKSTRLNSSHRL